MGTPRSPLFFLPDPPLMQERLHPAPWDAAAIHITKQRNKLIQHLSQTAFQQLETIYTQQGETPELATLLAKQTITFHRRVLAGGPIWHLGPQITDEIATEKVSLTPQTSYPVSSGALVLLNRSVNSEIPLRAISWALNKTTKERYALENTSPVLANIICYTETPNSDTLTPAQAYSFYIEDFNQPLELDTHFQPLIKTTWEIIERSPHPINVCDIPATHGGGILLRIP